MANNSVWSPAGTCPSTATNVVVPDLTDIRTKIGDVLTTQNSHENSITTHSDRITKLSNELTTLQTWINNIKITGGNINQAEFNAIKQRVTDLITRFDASDKVTIKAFQDAHKALTDVSKDLASKIKNNIKSINANRDAVNDLTTVTEQNKNVTIDAVSKLETDLRALINQLGAKLDLVDEHEIKIGAIDTEILQLKPLEKKVTDVEDKLTLTRDHVNDLNTHISDLTKLNNDAIINVTDNIDALGTTVANSLSNHDQMIEAIDTEIASLKVLINTLKVNGGNANQAELMALQAKVDIFQNRLDVLTANIQKNTTEDTQRNVELSQLQKDVKKLTEVQGNVGSYIANIDTILDAKIKTADDKLTAKIDAIVIPPEKLMHIVYSSQHSGINPTTGKSELSDTPDRFIGFYFGTKVDKPTEATEYSWVDSKDPTSTKHPHIWIKYSEYSTGRDSSHNIAFLPNNVPPEQRAYVGVAVSDSEPTLPDDYTWSRIRGIDGKDGKSSDQKLFIKYSQYPNGKDDAGNTVYSASKITRKYIGFATASTEPTDADGYDWTQFKGDMPSHVQPLYFHFMFARGKNGEDMSPLPEDRKWVGFVSNWESENAPQDFKQYRWMKLEGEKGERGDIGPSGKDGKDGRNGKDGYAQYTFMRFSPYATGESSPGISSFTAKPNKDTRYIGWSFNNQSPNAPREADDYFWYEIAIGSSKIGFTHIKYSDDMLSLHDDSTNKKFVGFSFGVDSPVDAPTDVTQYQWFELGQGIKGDTGKAGVPTYTHIVYSRYTDGFDLNRNPSYSENPDKETVYVGFRAGQKTETPDLTNPLLYKWVKIRGDLGLSLRTYFGFSDFRDGVDGKGVFAISQTYTGQRYMMISYNSASLSPPTRPDAYMLKIDLGKLSGKTSGFTQAEIENFCANISANMLGQTERKITALEKRIDNLPTNATGTVDLTDVNKAIADNKSDIMRLQASIDVVDADYLDIKNKFKTVEKDITDLKAKPSVQPQPNIPVDLEPIKNKLDVVEIRVTTLETDIAALKANPVAPQPNQPVDLTHITDKVNKFANDVTNFTAQVADNKARIAVLGLSDTSHGKQIKDNTAEITKLQDADKAINGRIDGLDTQIKAVDNRVNNLIVSAGDVNSAEIQTVKDSVNQLRTDHKKELDKLQDKKASHSYVRGLLESINEAKGSIGEVARINREMEDRLTRAEIAQRSFVHKRDVDSAVDPLRKALPRIDTLESDFKALSSNAYNADTLSKSNQTKIDNLKTKVDGYDIKIQNIADDLTKVVGGTAVTTKDLVDLSKELKAEIKTLDDSIESKVNSLVDKKLKALPSGTPLQIQSELDQLKQTVKALEAQIKAMQCSKVELKYSPDATGATVTDDKQQDSKYIGIKVDKCTI